MFWVALKRMTQLMRACGPSRTYLYHVAGAYFTSFKSVRSIELGHMKHDAAAVALGTEEAGKAV